MTPYFFEIQNAYLLSYNLFTAQVSNNNLLELNGFKVRNILATIFNSVSRDYILENLFHENGTFLSSDTKYELFKNMSSDERIDLKNYLRTYLDYQIESNWYTTICQTLCDESIKTLVVPTSIFRHNLLVVQLQSLFPKKKFVDWADYDGKKALIIDYNHAWKKRNIFTLNEPEVSAIFLKHFFKSAFQWKTYNDEKHLFNRMNSPTRKLLFGKDLLDSIKEQLNSLRPKQQINEWDVLHEREHNYSFNPQEEIIIHFNATNNNKYRINSSFILVNNNQYTMKSAHELASNPAQYENKFLISNTESIIVRIDLHKLNQAIEKDESIAQVIQPLWKKFDLEENNGRLWKQLLHRKSNEVGLENVFTEIENISGVRNFVSLNTFTNTYCNPENDSVIPREKKVFKAICQYLNLPSEYRAALHRERNLIGGHSQELRSKLKEFIKAIVEYEVLDKIKEDDALLDTINSFIEKIEKRVDMEYFGFSQDGLIYASIALCYEIIDKMRPQSIFKIEHIQPK